MPDRNSSTEAVNSRMKVMKASTTPPSRAGRRMGITIRAMVARLPAPDIRLAFSRSAESCTIGPVIWRIDTGKNQTA